MPQPKSRKIAILGYRSVGEWGGLLSPAEAHSPLQVRRGLVGWGDGGGGGSLSPKHIFYFTPLCDVISRPAVTRFLSFDVVACGGLEPQTALVTRGGGTR